MKYSSISFPAIIELWPCRGLVYWVRVVLKSIHPHTTPSPYKIWPSLHSLQTTCPNRLSLSWNNGLSSHGLTAYPSHGITVCSSHGLTACPSYGITACRLVSLSHRLTVCSSHGITAYSPHDLLSFSSPMEYRLSSTQFVPLRDMNTLTDSNNYRFL
jgi:hypothetical protein